MPAGAFAERQWSLSRRPGASISLFEGAACACVLGARPAYTVAGIIDGSDDVGDRVCTLRSAGSVYVALECED